ncbi:proline racemase family protein [Brevibacterium linens]|uniref:Proline racemase n=1 Tax=Brevibacterium linens TaxID=1703 RepID=A0A0B9AJX8_BRELN|nr:proline racemase family protein [Brevibacterium linens]KHS51054.1 Proline racemase [Brevibacterium linens]
MKTICTSFDFHTAGEPFRTVAEPPVEIPGESVAQRRELAVPGSALDDLRRLLCFEPRGHADMYGGFITPPDDDGADFGVLFWHKDGFSTACGHGTMALGAWAVSSGIVAVDPSGTTEVTIDVPSGRVRAQVHTDAEGRAASVDFVNVPSRLVASGITVDTSRGPVSVDLAWGGAIYALVDASDLGEPSLDVVPENLTALISLGREIKAGLADHPDTVHPEDDRLSGVYGTIFVDRFGTLPSGELHQRNVTIFADGQVDRSPCGSGTAARVAALHAAGELRPGQSLVHESIVGTRFRAKVLEETAEGVIPVVTGSAHRVATSTFELDPLDDLVPGFVLR